MRTRRKLTRLAALLSGCLLAGCSTAAVETVTDTSCQSFKPISMSKQDTEPTRRQIVGHNKAYDALCGEAPQKVAAR